MKELFGLLIIAALLYLALKSKERKIYQPSGLPAGFSPTHAHKNMALDAKSGVVWVRDETGFTNVLQRGQIVRWSVEARTMNNRVTTQIGHSGVKLVITTTDIDRPIYRVRFNGHTDLIIGGGNSNWKEAESWSSRLTAFCAM